MEILRIKEILTEKGITGKELAERVEVTGNALSLIINGKRQPRFELLSKIAETLEVDIRDLFVPTKEDTLETIYILKDGQYTPVGKLSLKKDK